MINVFRLIRFCGFKLTIQQILVHLPRERVHVTRADPICLQTALLGRRSFRRVAYLRLNSAFRGLPPSTGLGTGMVLYLSDNLRAPWTHLELCISATHTYPFPKFSKYCPVTHRDKLEATCPELCADDGIISPCACAYKRICSSDS
jgi:hypothetical protein